MQKSRIYLNDRWKFKQQDKDELLSAQVPGCVHTDLLNNRIIEDPFFRTNERKLQWIDKVNWIYQIQFQLTPKILKYKHHRLVFEGLDTYTDVSLNGTKILEADNMFRKWITDVKNLLQKENELKVVFRSPIKEDIPKYDALDYHLPAINDQSEIGELGDKRISIFARKAPYHYGWDWGPRFVTMGIWRPVYLESWNDVIIESVYYHQNAVNEKIARISAVIELNSDCQQTVNLKISNKRKNIVYADRTIVLEYGNQFITIPFNIKNPKLWWCHGLGEPNLYTFNAEILVGKKKITNKETKIGLRSINVIRKKDKKGRSFYFELNGKPIFAKGANYIPNDNFVTRVTPPKYEHIIHSAADANMNMLRVWGGGIYENDIFYNLCDQYGIMIWQDFMFACSMYPGDEAFLYNVEQEIIENIKRLRNHACIAIWCGNNENDWIWYLEDGHGWKKQFEPKIADKLWSDYQKVFYKMIPQLLKDLDPIRFYWPSSPMAEYDEHSSYTKTSGDMHYWGIWHNKEPFENFKKYPARFMSEYGFQSFPELSTVKKYTIPDDWDIDSEVMAAHQRSPIGNQRIKMYLDWDYHLPNKFSDMLYLSQVLQAEGIIIGMEAHRRQKPYCMGSLYWQINDCWPVASWSSIDYYGRWKALHYFAQKAFAPVLISPTLDDNVISAFLISDLLRPLDCTIVIKTIDFNGNVISKFIDEISLDANENRKIFESSIEKVLQDFDRNKTMLICMCFEQDKLISENVLYFDKVKNLDLQRPEISAEVKTNPSGYLISLKSMTLAKNVYLNIDDHDVFFSHNYFDLLPRQEIQIKCLTKSPIKNFSKKLKIISIYDTYQ